MKKLLKGLLLSVSVISFASSAWSAWWMYENNNYQLYSVAQPAKNISITKQDQKTEGVSYTSAVEITSPEQIEKARNDTSQPLYLRSFLSIPNFRISSINLDAVKPFSFANSCTFIHSSPPLCSIFPLLPFY